MATDRLSGTDGAVLDVFRPSRYPAVSFPSPIVTWGNGTDADPADYSTLLDHLASWGFTVVASIRPDTGSGREILAAARELTAEDHRKGSIYFGHLATHAVAAMGHSQGAAGAVRAAELGGAFVKTVVTFSLPWNGQGPPGTTWDRNPTGPRPLGWSGPNPDCPTALDCWPDPARLHQPTFLASTRGPVDSVIANPVVERCYFDEIDAPAALGIVARSDGRIADHGSIEDATHGGNPGAYLGPTTAWLFAELRNDPTAAALFFGEHESFTRRGDWAGSTVKRRPSAVRGCSSPR